MFAETSGSGHGKVGGVTPNQEPGSSEEAAWRPTATSPPTRFICVWYWQIYLLISPSIQGDFGGRMSKSSSYKQGPSLVARQSKGYSGNRSHTASGYPHPCPPRQGRATPRRSRGRAPRAGRRTPAPASASSPRRSGPTATCTTTTQQTRSVLVLQKGPSKGS